MNDAQRLQMDIDRQRRFVSYVLGPEGIAAQKALAPHLAALEARLPPFVPPVRGYAPMCYPGTTPSPSMITLDPDEQRTGVNMQLVLTRLARIEGIVKGMPPDNRVLDPIILFSGDDLREMPGQDSVRPDLDGRFSFTNVSPGRYKLFLRGAADGTPGAQQVRAEAEVVVSDEDIRNVALDLQPGVTVSGKLIFRGRRPPPSASAMARAGLQVALDPADPGPLTLYPGGPRVVPDATGQFMLRDVFPGNYKISMTQREPPEWFLDSVTMAGRDVTSRPVQVKRQDLTGVTVTFTDRRAELSGTILTGTGEPAPEYFLLIYPADERDWTPGVVFMNGARPKPDGTYVVRGLRAGTYRLATIIDVELGAWFDPAYLRQIDPSSRTASFAGEERKTLNLRVPDAR